MDRPAPQIVVAVAGDAGRIASLHAASWRMAYRGLLPDSVLGEGLEAERRQLWLARMRDIDPSRWSVWLAFDGQVDLGFACVRLDAGPGRDPLLDNLHVHPEAKGRGIGRALFGVARRWAVDNAPGRPLHLWVIEGNLPARGFYDRLGGRVVGRGLRKVAGADDVPELCYEWPPP
jgi:GNAT superfamily N-acetyltransferase